MKQVAKYNIYKGISTTLTFGTPICTMFCCSSFYKNTPSTSISATGVFVILIMLLLFKDKILENFKLPSAFIISLVVFGLIILLENILEPIKIICITTAAATGVDELTFKRCYQQLELLMPQQSKAFKHIGFFFTTSKNLEQYKGVNNG